MHSQNSLGIAGVIYMVSRAEKLRLVKKLKAEAKKAEKKPKKETPKGATPKSKALEK